MTAPENSNNDFPPSESMDFQSRQAQHSQPDIVYKSRVAAAAFALFGGAFGLHRFYLGQWRALVYVLLCWTPIPWLVALVECVIFMATDQQRWNQKYNQGLSNGRESAKVLATFLILGVLLAVTALIASVYIPFKMLSGMVDTQADIDTAQVVSTSAQDYILRTGRRPQNLAQLTLPSGLPDGYASRLQIENGRLIFVFPQNANEPGGELIMQPVIVQEKTYWDCSESTVPTHFFPDNCR